jgi:calcineurin-like phosphoesterase
VLDRFLNGVSERFNVQRDGPKQFCAAVATIDTESGKASAIKRIFLRGLA